MSNLEKQKLEEELKVLEDKESLDKLKEKAQFLNFDDYEDFIKKINEKILEITKKAENMNSDVETQISAVQEKGGAEEDVKIKIQSTLDETNKIVKEAIGEITDIETSFKEIKYNHLVNQCIESNNKESISYKRKETINVEGDMLSIEDFLKDPSNLDKIEILDHLSVLINKIPSDEIFKSFLEHKIVDNRLIEKIGSFPLDTKLKFIESLSKDNKEILMNAYKRLDNSLHEYILKNDQRVSFIFAIRMVNIPIKRYEIPNINNLFKAKKDFLIFYKNAMERKDPYVVSSFFENDLIYLFRSCDNEYMKKDEVIKMTKEVLRAFVDENRSDFQEKIIKNVLKLVNKEVITQEEANDILKI